MEKKENHSYKKLYTGVINTLCITPVDKKANKLLKKKNAPNAWGVWGRRVYRIFCQPMMAAPMAPAIWERGWVCTGQSI